MSEHPKARRFLPAPGSLRYHLLLGAVALFILGPLGGVTAAYMTFSLGFSVGGQVLAGILGSVVTYGYGTEGKHGANYIQTMAASVASMAGMGVLIQAMIWLGMPLPSSWKIGLYFGCIGMLGIGVGMLYTPVLVDRLQLEFPSGHAVANILRALTDKRLLRRSIAKLGGGTLGGVAIGALVPRLARMLTARLEARRWQLASRTAGAALGSMSASTVGAGMIVGSRIGVPAAVMAAVGELLIPHLRATGVLGPHDPFRKIGFLVGLAMIMGAAVVDLTLIGVEAVRRVRAQRGATTESKSGGLGTGRLTLWVTGWAIAVVLVATLLLNQPIGFTLLAIALVFVFVFVNGISDGISDWNPISSAFVMSVLLMSGLGLRSPTVAMTAASILLITCTVGVDMQQDRSTGWRLGSDRAIQFRYQAIGIVMGAVLCILLTQFFLHTYPVLTVDTFAHPETNVGVWQSSMTFKFVGAIRGLGHLKPVQITALWIGFAIGLATEIGRKLLARARVYQRFIASGRGGFAIGWIVDAVLLPSPYASSTGGFLEFSASAWFAGGSLLGAALGRRRPPALAPEAKGDALPEDMSTASLIGGGLIAGESLYTLGVGVAALLLALKRR
jgi:uncharacterized oligopeptide transporter (OPT) family protein